MKTIRVVYLNQNNHEANGFLLESIEDWNEAVKLDKIWSVTEKGFLKSLQKSGKVFLNLSKGYCDIDNKTIKIVN